MIMFGKYADFYDALYKDKDYAGECDAIEEIFGKYSKKKISSILDLGCGTGNHAFILHNRGYKIVGVDRSEAMLANAKKKLAKLDNKKSIRFEKGDIRSWQTREKFDAVVMMFAVLGYQLEDEDIQQAFQTVRHHLKKDGLFIFDVWYGPAVLSQRPSKRTKTIDTKKGKISRIAYSELDTSKNICSVHYAIGKLKEVHKMRYFSPQEITVFLKKSRLELLKLGRFPNWRQKPDKTTWNIFCIARAV